MPKIKLPSIELPRSDDLKSMQNAIAQMKEAIELMSGVRGDKYFLSADDLEQMQSNFRKHQRFDTWETIADEYLPNVPNSKEYTGLGDYHALRLVYHIVPLTATGTWPYLRAGANGVVDTSYSGTLRYNIEGSATVSGSIGDTSVVALSWINPVAPLTNNSYGCQGVMTITNFNTNVQSMFATQATWYTGTNILHGEFIYRQNGASPYNFLHFAMGGDATPFAMRMFIEGKRRP